MLALFTCSPNHFLQIRVQFFSYTIEWPLENDAETIYSRSTELNWILSYDWLLRSTAVSFERVAIRVVKNVYLNFTRRILS